MFRSPPRRSRRRRHEVCGCGHAPPRAPEPDARRHPDRKTPHGGAVRGCVAAPRWQPGPRHRHRSIPRPPPTCRQCDPRRGHRHPLPPRSRPAPRHWMRHGPGAQRRARPPKRGVRASAVARPAIPGADHHHVGAKRLDLPSHVSRPLPPASARPMHGHAPRHRREWSLPAQAFPAPSGSLAR